MKPDYPKPNIIPKPTKEIFYGGRNYSKPHKIERLFGEVFLYIQDLYDIIFPLSRATDSNVLFQLRRIKKFLKDNNIKYKE